MSNTSSKGSPIHLRRRGRGEGVGEWPLSPLAGEPGSSDSCFPQAAEHHQLPSFVIIATSAAHRPCLPLL